MSDIAKKFYPGTMICFIRYLQTDFKRYYEMNHITGWQVLYNTLCDLEIEILHGNPQKELENSATLVEKLRDAQSLAKDLLGHHIHINFLWRLEQMIVQWPNQANVKFSDFEIKF